MTPLFDMAPMFELPRFTQTNPPRARATDPATSKAAARVVKHGSEAMNAAILESASQYESRSAFELAEYVEAMWPGRWAEGGIRSAVSGLGKRGLLVKDGKGKSPRGQACDLWRLP